MAKIKLDANAIIKALQERQVKATNAVLEEAKKYAESISPTDESNYIKKFRIIPARYSKWNAIEGKLVNDSEYANILEYWVKGKTYQYHRWPRSMKDRPVIYTWVGNRTLTRTRDATKNLFRKKLAQW